MIPILLACLLSAGSARTGEPARGRVPERREKYGYGSCFRCANFLLFQSNFRYDAEFLIVGFGNISLEIEGSGRRDVEAVNGGGVDEELLREANYLKSCGTISKTPPEILEVPSSTSSEEPSEVRTVSAMLFLIYQSDIFNIVF